MRSKNQNLPLGTLSDTDIISLCSQRKLIINNYSQSNVQQACYELRASNIYYDIATNNKFVLKDGDYILLKPKQLTVIITQEELELPADILGRVLTKGKLFSIGLLPVNTYADPGFSGQLGIVLHNLSNNFLKVYPGESIAKIEFTRLQNPVAKPYRGQHGYQSSMWPIPEDMILSSDELKKDPRIGFTTDEIMLSYGKGVGNVIERVFKFERYLIITALAYFLFSIILIYTINKSNWYDPLFSLVLGVVSNIITSLVIYTATNIRRQ